MFGLVATFGTLCYSFYDNFPLWWNMRLQCITLLCTVFCRMYLVEHTRQVSKLQPTRAQPKLKSLIVRRKFKSPKMFQEATHVNTSQKTVQMWARKKDRERGNNLIVSLIIKAMRKKQKELQKKLCIRRKMFLHRKS